MAAPILPTVDQLVGKAIDAIVAARASTLPHFNGRGRYYDLIVMWRAQGNLLLTRLAAEVNAARLRFAKGDELRALCASEFQTTLPPEPQSSFATIQLTRPAPTFNVVTTSDAVPNFLVTCTFLTGIGTGIGLSCLPLPGPLTAGTVLTFSGGGGVATLTANFAAGTTVIIVNVTGHTIPVGAQAPASITITSLTVQPLAAPIASGFVLSFSDGSSATTSAPASIGATTIAVQALTAEVRSGLVAQAPNAAAAPQGIIPSGTLFTKQANPDGIPLPAANAYPLPVQGASYTSIAPVYVPPGQLTATVQAEAVAAGANANVPTFSNAGYSAPTLIQPSKPPFDQTFAVTSSLSSGGSSGLTDPVLVSAARAHAIGQFGPTDGAMLAGALELQSVRHFAAFPANDSLTYAQVYIADESWSSSTAWVSQVAQHVADNWQGFGCRIRFGTVTNLQIAIAPTIVLASTDALNYTEAVDVNVRAAAEAYFNDRPDWYSWRADSLRAAISACDSRILFCSSVVVSDAVTNTPLTEPVNAFGTSNSFQITFAPTVTHYYLLDRGVTSLYQPPS